MVTEFIKQFRKNPSFSKTISVENNKIIVKANIGTSWHISTNKQISIKELAHTIASVVGYQGRMNFDVDKPDGAPRKLLDSRIMKDLGWTSSIRLDDGIKKTYDWFLATQI